MRIKRKHYAKLQAELTSLRNMAATRIVIGSEAGNLMDVTVEHLTMAARFAGNENTPDYMIGGPITFQVIPPEYASGYESFLVSKYTSPDDEPWATIRKLREKLDAPHRI